MTSKPVLALIPARSGSKSMPHKNIRHLAGKPMLSWSIEYALGCREVDRVLVSTDSEHYAEVARNGGAEVPFLRPAEISGDGATDLDVFLHALEWLRVNESYVPGFCLHVRPTCPVRRAGLADEMIRLLRDREDLDAVRTVAPVRHPPYKMWSRDGEGTLSPLLRVEGIDEPWNTPRQTLPDTYIQTANLDVVRTRVITEEKSMAGQRIHGMVENEFWDIDTEAEFQRAAGALREGMAGTGHALKPELVDDDAQKRVFCFDIDGVIASITPPHDYGAAEPQPGMISCINRLYDQGHRIVLFTARGTQSGIDWRPETERQMKTWGVKYHELGFGKPAADYYVDDRMIGMDEVMDLADD